MSTEPPSPRPDFPPLKKRKSALFGLDLDGCIQAFFGGNAVVAIVVLALITIFLFREGIGFFGQNRENLTIYRRAGLELADIPRRETDDFTALTRYLSDIRSREVRRQMSLHSEMAQINASLREFDRFANDFNRLGRDLKKLAGEWTERATELKDRSIRYHEQEKLDIQIRTSGESQPTDTEARIETIDWATEWNGLREAIPALLEVNSQLTTRIAEVLKRLPDSAEPTIQRRLIRFEELAVLFTRGLPARAQEARDWDPERPVPFGASFNSFIFGRDWITNSFFQDWYGILPLFTGSLLVALIALSLAVPFSVAAAVYVNQLARPWEQRFIKPSLEFISAIPSVVVGFFGVAIFGQMVRLLTETPALSWVPFFPIAERLNSFTAGCLLALMATPTIFTLSEDALNNVPRAYTEASLSLGATLMQTIMRIIIPAALSGIMSAILLGFGRVIGETMVVLLCAGNRITIPDFTLGPGVFFQPVHTMTGIIAQEMGEVVHQSLHYRALFMVGLVLFFLSLSVNYLAQRILRRYKLAPP